MLDRDVAHEDALSAEHIEQMEEDRIKSLNEAGIDEQDVLRESNQRVNTWNSYFNENIVRGKDDMNFVWRDQWTAVERSEFTRLFKPAMTFNKLYDPLKKIVAEQRKNKPNLIVRSLTGRADQKQINLRADLVRTISYQSQNDLVYQTAFKNALMLGFGAFQIGVDYESPKSFHKIATYELITDPTRCAWDPSAAMPHKGDGNFCARFYVYTKDEFYATYPYVTNPVSYIDPWMLLDAQWNQHNTITVCDYFVKEWYPCLLLQLSNGDTVTEREWEEMKRAFAKKMQIVEGSRVEKILEKDLPYIVSERQTQDYRIMHYRMIRNQIIEFSEWPSKYLPIIFVDGDSTYIEGRQYTKSFIHDARDAQKFVNYVGSEIAAEIKNRRREQWLGTPDNIIGYEQDWRNPELQIGMLRAKPDPKTGMMPQKQPPWDLSPALIQNFQRGTQDIKEIMGFSESEQLQGRDISGKARRQRNLEGSMSAFVFMDNMNQAIAQGGRVVNDLLPYLIGDNERHFVLTKKDGKSESIIINQRMGEDMVTNQIARGDFDVEIDAGPSFAVQKEIALEFFQQTISNNPQVFNLIADLWAGNLDIENMEQVKERLKTLVPPQVIAQEEGKQLPPPQPSPQDMMMQAELQDKMSKIQLAREELELKRQQHELDKAELMLKGQKMRADSQLDVYNHQAELAQSQIAHGLDRHKAELNYETQIAKILSDLHKHENPHSTHR